MFSDIDSERRIEMFDYLNDGPDDIDYERAIALDEPLSEGFYPEWDGPSWDEVTPDDDPTKPCGYCRRCALHDDPAGCLTVEAWERENPEEAARRMAIAADVHRIVSSFLPNTDPDDIPF